LATPIRAVGLLVLVFTIAVVGGAFAIVVFFSDHPQVLSWADLGVFYGAALLLLLTSVAATGVIGWLLLRRRATGQQLTNWLNVNPPGRLRALTLARPISAAVVVFMIVTV